MTTRRRESPVRRVYGPGRVAWLARYTNRDGKRVSAGTFDKKGPCKTPGRDCCAQHAIDAAYDLMDAAPSQAVPTIRRYAETWLRAHPRSDRTNRTNEHRLKVLIGPFTTEQRAKGKGDGIVVEGRPLGDWPIDELRRKHVRLLLDELLSVQGRSAGGAKNLLLVLSALYTDAIDDFEDVPLTNPCLNVKVKASDPRVTKPPRAPRVVSIDDMRRLAEAAGEHEVMVRLASDCGLRLGELLGLAPQDVKLGGRCDELGCKVDGPHLHVRRTAHGGAIEEGTKRERMRNRLEGGRVAPLTPACVALLKALPPRIQGPMFFSPQGRPWREDTFRNEVWNPARKASGVEASPHDFRHSWVTHLRAAGVDPSDLAAMGGHTVETATAVYTHSLGRSYDAVREAMG